MKTPVILRIFKSGQLVEVKQFDVDQIIIGHEAEVHLDLNDGAVSPIHCLIEKRDSGYYLSDLGSQSGTLKNGQPVLDDALSSGDQIGIGPFSIQFFVGIPKPKAPPAMTMAPPSPAPPAPPVAKPSAPPPPPSAPKSVPPSAPKIPGASVSKSREDLSEVTQPRGIAVQKKRGTFAPASEVRDLRETLKPTKGGSLEVVVAWKERVLQVYHFSAAPKVIRMGPAEQGEIFVPPPFATSALPLVQVGPNGAQVFAAASVQIEAVTSSQTFRVDEMVRSGKATRTEAGYSIRLDQGDLVCLGYGDGTLQIFIRYVPAAPIPIIASLLDLSGGEVTGVIASLVLVALLALYMSVYTPPEAEQQKEEEQVRLAQFVYNKPKSTPTPQPTPEPTPVATPPPVVKATPTPEIKKIKVTEEKVENKKAGVKDSVAAAKERPAEKAAEVRPNPSAKDRPKKFTSVKQGGAVKMGDTASANAQSAKDVNKTGLLSAFGGGGTRKQLDQAYSGSGELLGMAEKATGTSGQNENRAGDDIGSKIKDAGAGGKGTATQGIAGVGTKGRSSGNSAYGGIGFGGKGNVSIDAGGTDADFVGTIDKEAVRRVIRSILSQIKSCYERQLRSNSSLEGKVIITFEIEEQGRVRVAKTKNTSLNDSVVESCVAARIKEQRFPEPPPGTVAVVDYPFVFGAQK